MIIKANQNPTEILQLGEQALDFPTPFVATKFTSVLRFRALAILFMRRDQLGFKLGEAFVQRSGIISPVAGQFSQSLVGKTRTESLFDKLDFMRLSRLLVDGERKT